MIVRRAVLPLFLTSLSFALVHDDVINILLGLTLVNVNSVVIISMRLAFGIAVGNLYLFKRKMAVPAASHVFFNLSYSVLAHPIRCDCVSGLFSTDQTLLPSAGGSGGKASGEAKAGLALPEEEDREPGDEI